MFNIYIKHSQVTSKRFTFSSLIKIGNRRKFRRGIHYGNRDEKQNLQKSTLHVGIAVMPGLGATIARTFYACMASCDF